MEEKFRKESSDFSSIFLFNNGSMIVEKKKYMVYRKR